MGEGGGRVGGGCGRVGRVRAGGKRVGESGGKVGKNVREGEGGVRVWEGLLVYNEICDCTVHLVYKIRASTGIAHSIIWEGSQAELKPDLLDQLPPEKSTMECMVC